MESLSSSRLMIRVNLQSARWGTGSAACLLCKLPSLLNLSIRKEGLHDCFD